MKKGKYTKTLAKNQVCEILGNIGEILGKTVYLDL